MAMKDMPVLGGYRARGRARAVAGGMVVALLAGGLLWWRLRGRPEPPPPPVVTPPPAEAPAPIEKPAEKPIARSPGEDALKRAGLKHLHAVIEGPLERAVTAQVGREVGQPLTQVVVRLLVWWVDVPSGLRKGDLLDVLYEERDGQEPVVHAVRFQSGKANQVFRAYRFKPPAAKHARYFTPEGDELEMRLKDGPIDEYEQVTSLLRDGRGHKGVDFKAPVGTPVKAPFDGEITRRTWHFKTNGNSLELRESGGRHRVAMLLHLSPIADDVRPGLRVQKGQVIAQSGNTGHSFAPHLHYQLMSASSQVLDPFANHETVRLSLEPAQRAAFDGEVKRLDGLIALVTGDAPPAAPEPPAAAPTDAGP